MKNLLTATTCALFFALLLVTGCAKNTTPVNIGGFETKPVNSSNQHAWSHTDNPKTRDFVQFEWDEEIFHNDEHSVSIAINADHPDDAAFYNWSRILSKFELAQTYELTGWIRTENLKGPAMLLAHCLDSETQEILNFSSTLKQFPMTGTMDWTEVGTVFTVPEGTDMVRIRAGMMNPQCRGGQVWFDDVEVRKSEPDIADIMLGTWSGALDVGVKLRLVLNVEHPQWRVTIDSVDQGVYGMIVSNLTVNDNQVSFELKKEKASYSGVIVDADHIEGTWTQGGSLPLNFERTNEVPRLLRPQEPQEPFPYTIEEVAYSFDPDNIEKTLITGTNPENNSLITLQGTLTLPQGKGPHPCVLLISGSGPQDRDETLMNHKPFWVLADYLSRRGLAVLRVDDRGTGKSTGDFGTATTEDFSKDATAGFLYLKNRTDIAADRVALLGHSEGGLIAPMVAVDRPDVAAIVLMAGPGVSGIEVAQLQLKLMNRANGATEKEIESASLIQSELIKILNEDLSHEDRISRIDEYLTELYSQFSLEEQNLIGSLDSFIESRGETLKSPWMLWFFNYDPGPTLSQVTCPVLAVFGGKDVQVDADQNLPVIEAALESGVAEDFTMKELPGLNHLFQHCETGAMAEYGLIEETLAPEFLDLVNEWLQERLRGDQK